MKRIVEAAGEIWHEKLNAPLHCYTCRVGCVTYHPAEISDFLSKHANPSKDDLNELFRLAEKLGFDCSIVTNLKRTTEKRYLVCVWRVSRYYAHAKTPEKALYTALIKAVEAREKVFVYDFDKDKE